MKKLIIFSFLLSVFMVKAQTLNWLENDLYQITNITSNNLKNIKTGADSYVLSSDILPGDQDGWIEITNIRNNPFGFGIDHNSFIGLRFAIAEVNQYDISDIIANGYVYHLKKQPAPTGGPYSYCINGIGGDNTATCDQDGFTLQSSDVLRIEKTGNTIYFKFNGTIIDQATNINPKNFYRLSINSKTQNVNFDYTYSNFVAEESVISPLETNENRNWISSAAFDATGTLKASGITYFDELGKQEQSQSLDLKTGRIWATETRYDTQGRPALQTLGAPIGNVLESGSSTTYKTDFIKKTNGATYNNSDFENAPDNPAPIGDQEHSLGWYYSENNIDEPYQDVTDYPFTRTIYDKLNPGKALKVLGGNKVSTANGDQWVNGFSHSMTAAQEMYYVFGTDHFNLPSGGGGLELNYKVFKSVGIDVHGNEVVSFSDAEGLLLGAARSGGAQKYEVVSLIGQQGYVDVHIPKGIVNSDIFFLSPASNYTIYDLRTSQVVSASNMTGGNVYRLEAAPQEDTRVVLSGGSLDALSDSGQNPHGIKYKVNYYDYTLNYYDKAGRLLKTTQPLGFDSSSLTTITPSPSHGMQSTFEYNAIGELQKTESPDEGEAIFKYREDGQIRYSQNSKQAEANEFSYTSYDDRARPLESGVYYGPESLEGATSLGTDLTNLIGVKEIGNNSVQKIGKNSWNSGTATTDIITGQGGISYSVPYNDKAMMVGLSTDNTNYSYNTIDYALYTRSDGLLNIYKSGSNITTIGNGYQAGDNFEVRRNSSNKIEFVQNGQVLYTTTESVSGNLLGDIAFHTPESSINNVQLFGSVQTPSGLSDFINVNGVSVSGNTITKTSTSNTWSNHGLATFAKAQGDLNLSWTADRNDDRLMVGLTSKTYFTNNQYVYMDYAIFLAADGAVKVYENGRNKGTFGNYVSGDNFEIVKNGGQISYKRNGTTFYVSEYPSENEELMARVNIHNSGDRVLNFSFDGQVKKFRDYKSIITYDNTISKIAGFSWNADVTSTNSLNGEGYLQFQASSDEYSFGMVGLSEINANTNHNTIDYAIYLHSNRYAYARESGSYIYSMGSYEPNDVFKVERDENGIIKYYKNDVLKYTSAASQASPSVNPLVLDMSLIEHGTVINNIELFQLNDDVVDLEENLPDVYCKEQHFTVYDIADATGLTNILTPEGWQNHYSKQEFVAGNVSKTYTKKPETTTTWYSYDIYGRVTWMIQHINSLGVKTIDYTYDDVSGQVVKVDYQRHMASERLVHRYNYNDVDQLVSVNTSFDDAVFTRQAAYTYYENGSLKRTELANGLQGTDYVYNLAGVLKSINHPDLDSETDPGGDPNDIFGMIIDYHENDYLRSGTDITTSSTGDDRHDGNIKAIRWANESINNGDQSGYVYEYDENSWLTQAQFGVAASNGNITLGNDYKVSNLTYDPNGNLLSLNRTKNMFSGSNAMDAFTYNYNSQTNQLNYVSDAITASTNADDLKDQPSGNYIYNSIGQLTNDLSNGTRYKYNASGLVTEASNGNLPPGGSGLPWSPSYPYGAKFTYNDKGHRNSKETFQTFGVAPGYASTTRYYVRDASGSVMAIYNYVPPNPFEITLGGGTPGPTITLGEQPIYGASRLGVLNRVSNSTSYQLSDHLGNVRGVIATNGSDYPIILDTDFDDGSYTPWHSTDPSTVISVNNGRLQCDQSVDYKGVRGDINLTAGKTYNMTLDIDIDEIDGDFKLQIYDSSWNLVSGETITNNGRHSVLITPTISGNHVFALRVWIPNSPSTFYLDNILIKDVTNTNVDVLVHKDYYPFGMPMPDRNIEGDYRYAFQGQEKDPETGKEAFELRLWDSRIGRWLTPDPYGQFHSPYLGMGNNPINGVDKDGGIWLNIIAGVVGAAINAGINYYDQGGFSGKEVDWGRVALAGGTGFVAGVTLNPAIAAGVNAAGDVGDQLLENGGDFENIDYGKAAITGISTYVGGKVIANNRLVQSVSRKISEKVHSSTGVYLGKTITSLKGGRSFGNVAKSESQLITAFSETTGGLLSGASSKVGLNLYDKFKAPEFKFEPVDPFRFNDWTFLNNLNNSSSRPGGSVIVGPLTQSGPVEY